MINVSNLRIEGLLHGISFTLKRGQRLGIIGESGSGKSLTALSIMGLTDLPAEGSITVDGVEMVGTPERTRRRVRGSRVAMVFQEPMTALDPLKKIGKIVPRHLLQEVGVDRPEAYPHELSGGQRQRVLIALALAGDPDFLLCDEPTTALDVTVQRQILDLIDTVVRRRGMGLLFISHDMPVVRHMTQEVLVFRAGSIEPADSAYSRKLLNPTLPTLATAPREVGAPVVTLRGVSVTRGTTKALRNVNLEVRRGERIGIVGGSGSGKTTLLHVIAGLRGVDSGEVRINGGCQMVFQDPYSSLDPRMRVGASVEEAGVDTRRAREMLAAVGLEGTEQRLPREFSGGQRQRISIARATAATPDILLADEPVSALDATLRNQVLTLLDQLASTLVFVSHDLGVVRALCPRTIVMHEGEIVEEGRTQDVLRNPQHEYTRRLIDSMF